MDSNVYYRHGVVGRIGKRTESAEGPWLDDSTTRRYRPSCPTQSHPLRQLASETRLPIPSVYDFEYRGTDSRAPKRKSAWRRRGPWAAAVLLCIFTLALLARTSELAQVFERLSGSIEALRERITGSLRKAESAPDEPSQVVPDESGMVRPGILRIDSHPLARVFLDDVLIGNTPQLTISLSPGPHNLRLVDIENALEKTVSLDVHAGEVIDRVERLAP